MCKSIGWSTRPEKQPTERGEPHWLPCVHGKWATASVCASPVVVSARSVIPEAVSAVGQLSDLRANCPRKKVERHVANYTPRTSQYVIGKAKKKKRSEHGPERSPRAACSVPTWVAWAMCSLANTLWPWDVLASSWTPLRLFNAPACALATPVSSNHEPPAVGPDSVSKRALTVPGVTRRYAEQLETRFC